MNLIDVLSESSISKFLYKKTPREHIEKKEED